MSGSIGKLKNVLSAFHQTSTYMSTENTSEYYITSQLLSF